MKKLITLLYSALFFGIPLVFYSKTSELFEFNKIVLLYAITLLIAGLWTAESILHKKIVFKRTILDIPLVIFVSSQILSTIFSIDVRTSIFGYYSRFNGGLLSVFCYAILYWAFVTHIQKKDLKRLLYNLFFSTAIAAVWGVLEHFGKSPSCLIISGDFDTSCWVQDVQLRVFSTFGQPNWMAAWMAAVIPLTYIGLLSKKHSAKKIQIAAITLGILFFAALLFTKSKSGLAGFGISFAVAIALILIFQFKNVKKTISKWSILIPISILAVTLVFGSPWTPSLSQFSQSKVSQSAEKPSSGTALETGGTDSGEIRKIVWQGAVNVWKQFPIVGSGVETFAYSYYRGRPLSHNLVSEWNFLYNKAHNEYLNYLATTGVIGLGSYSILIASTLYLMWKTLRSQRNTSDFYIVVALLSGYISILVTNFFGFSVVPVSILFALIPAATFSLTQEEENETVNKNISNLQKTSLTVCIIIFSYLLFLLFNYWKADYLFAAAKDAENNSDYTVSLTKYRQAVDLSPNESLYHAQLGSLYADLTTASEADASLVETFTSASKQELVEAQSQSPQNVRIIKSIANSYATLGDIDPQYLAKTLDLTKKLQMLAPTDPSVLYQQCLTLAKLGRLPDAIASGEQAVSMKADYKIARRLLAFLYEQTKEPQKAKTHLEYILKYISPDDVDVQKELQKITSQK